MPPDPVLAEARATTRSVARTFALACRLLPRSVRDDVYRLYLVFRTLDDLVDDADPSAPDAVAAVEGWARGGPARTPTARILADIDGRTPLPREPLLDFCAGMRHDIEGVPIVTEDDLDRYCYRVAGTVGIVMSELLGTRGAAQDAAAALGAAMQRTNILRDIDEDRSAGRVYLARETIERCGGSIAPGERMSLVRDQIARADALYEEGLAGAAQLRRGRLRSAPPRTCTARSCARSSARVTARDPAARPYRPRARSARRCKRCTPPSANTMRIRGAARSPIAGGARPVPQCPDASLATRAPATVISRLVFKRTAVCPNEKDAMVELRFEGSTLKRPCSVCRGGRSSNWRKVKVRHTASRSLIATRVGGDRATYAICDVAGARLTLSSPTVRTARPSALGVVSRHETRLEAVRGVHPRSKDPFGAQGRDDMADVAALMSGFLAPERGHVQVSVRMKSRSL